MAEPPLEHGFADLGRSLAALAREDDGFAVRGELHVVESVVAADGDARAAAFHADELDGLAAAVFDGEEEAFRIGRPGKAVDRAVDGVRRNGELAGGALEHDQTPAVAFVSSARLGPVSEIFAIRRILRGIIRAGIAR